MSCRWAAVEHWLIFGCFDCGEEAEAVGVDAVADGCRVAFVEAVVGVAVAAVVVVAVDPEMVQGAAGCGRFDVPPAEDVSSACCGRLFDDCCDC